MSQKKTKPKYNLWQNIGFMLRLAWKHHKSVIFLMEGETILTVLGSLLTLLLAPTILGQIEQNAPIESLVRAIVFFSLSLLLVYGAKAYIEQNKLFGRIYLREQIMRLINQKAMQTSYENVEKKDFRDASTEACRALDDPGPYHLSFLSQQDRLSPGPDRNSDCCGKLFYQQTLFRSILCL